MSSSTSEPSEEEKFSSNATALANTLCREIIELQKRGYCSEISSVILNIVPSVIKAWDKTSLINSFIENSSGDPVKEEIPVCWEMVRAKDLTFFVQNADKIFASKLPVENVNMFSNVFTKKDKQGNPLLSAETIEYIWKIFSGMIRISIKYVHRKRRAIPHLDETGEVKYRYTAECFDHLNIPELALLWNFKLPS